MYLHEAYATGRRMRSKKSTTDAHHDWFKLTNKWYGLNLEDAIADDWEVEPEIYEVECGWEIYDTNLKPEDMSEVDYKTVCGLVGKRTKLTIEVLD